LFFIKNYQTTAKSAAHDLIAKSPVVLEALQTTFRQHFPHSSVSAVTQLFTTNDNNSNPQCEMAIAAALDASDSVLQALAILERYITLTVPKMEDGGNFGVSVQLNAIKVLADATKKIEDGTEELYKYASARADAMEKCKTHPSVSTTKTSTAVTTTSTGNDSEKGDTQNNANTQTNEEKTVESQTDTIEAAWRKQAVTMVDVRFYGKAKAVRTNTNTNKTFPNGGEGRGTRVFSHVLVSRTAKLHCLFYIYKDIYQCHHGIHGRL
jgi:hypothetical protein